MKPYAAVTCYSLWPVLIALLPRCTSFVFRLSKILFDLQDDDIKLNGSESESETVVKQKVIKDHLNLLIRVLILSTSVCLNHSTRATLGWTLQQQQQQQQRNLFMMKK